MLTGRRRCNQVLMGPIEGHRIAELRMKESALGEMLQMCVRGSIGII